jgi:hypothetical protein
MTEYDRWMENDVRYSTDAAHDWRPGGRRYLSAEDAVDQYLRLRSEMSGQPAIDYERAMCVDTSPSPENPASLQAHEAFFLKQMFRRARQKVEDFEWRVWGVIRIECYTLAEAARAEQKRRRQELKRLHGREQLEAWCEHYRKSMPDGEDPWSRLLEQPGISDETARTYRDEVDARIEQQLVGQGVLIRNAVRDEDDERDIEQPNEVLA